MIENNTNLTSEEMLQYLQRLLIVQHKFINGEYVCRKNKTEKRTKSMQMFNTGFDKREKEIEQKIISSIEHYKNLCKE